MKLAHERRIHLLQILRKNKIRSRNLSDEKLIELIAKEIPAEPLPELESVPQAVSEPAQPIEEPAPEPTPEPTNEEPAPVEEHPFFPSTPKAEPAPQPKPTAVPAPAPRAIKEPEPVAIPAPQPKPEPSQERVHESEPSSPANALTRKITHTLATTLEEHLNEFVAAQASQLTEERVREMIQENNVKLAEAIAGAIKGVQ